MVFCKLLSFTVLAVPAGEPCTDIHIDALGRTVQVFSSYANQRSSMMVNAVDGVNFVIAVVNHGLPGRKSEPELSATVDTKAFNVFGL